MSIVVDIADRLFDYSDEEVAGEAIASFQEAKGIDDAMLLVLWQSGEGPLFLELEKLIFDAVDANGSVKRAKNSIPNGISLSVE